MTDWSQKKKLRKINLPATDSKKLVATETPPSRGKFITQNPSGCAILQFGKYGTVKTRGHKCLCDMDASVRSEIDVFFKKVQRTSCDIDSFLSH
jgi:hypothetical protein